MQTLDKFETLTLQLHKNNRMQQTGSAKDMIFPIVHLIQQIADAFTLEPGDIILTGTPAGVSALEHGDTLTAELITEQPLIKTQCHISRHC